MAAAPAIDPLAQEMLDAIRKRRPNPDASASPMVSPTPPADVDPLAAEMLTSIQKQRAAPAVAPSTTSTPAGGATAPIVPPPVERLGPATRYTLPPPPALQIPKNVTPRRYNKPQSELDYAQFQEERKTLPSSLTQPGHVPGIPLQERDARQTYALARWYNQDRPKAIRELNVEAAALRADRQKIDALQAAGRPVPRNLLVAHESRRLGIEQRNKEIEGLTQRYEDAARHAGATRSGLAKEVLNYPPGATPEQKAALLKEFRRKGEAEVARRNADTTPVPSEPQPIHGGMWYPEEVAAGEGQPGRLQGLLSHVSGAAGTEMQVPAIRTALQWEGRYPPPPAIPYKDRARGIKEMQDLRGVVALYGDRLRDDGTLAPIKGGFEAGSDASRRIVKNLTPWQRQSIATVRQQVAAERDAYDLARVGKAGAIDVVALAAAEGVGGAIGNLMRGPAKEYLKRYAPRLFVRYMEATAPELGAELAPLSRKALNQQILRAAPEVAIHTTTGAAAGGTFAGTATVLSGGTPRQTLEATGRGALLGAGIGGGTAALSSVISGTLRGGWNANTPRLIEQVADQARREGLVAEADLPGFKLRLERVAKAPAVARGRLLQQIGRDFPQAAEGAPRGASAPRPPVQAEVIPPERAAPKAGPRIRTQQGQEIALRETPRETLQQVAQSGDPQAAAAAQHWLNQAEAHDVQMDVKIPDSPEARQAWWKAFQKSDAFGWKTDLEAAATTLARTNPELAAKLTEAAKEANRNFTYSYVLRTAPELAVEPTVAPPSVSIWRTLSPGEQDALPPAARKALLALDLSNSLTTIAPTREPVLRLNDEGNYKKEQALREAADQTFESAQTVASRRFVPPAVEVAAPPVETQSSSVPAQTEAPQAPVPAQMAEQLPAQSNSQQVAPPAPETVGTAAPTVMPLAEATVTPATATAPTVTPATLAGRGFQLATGVGEAGAAKVRARAEAATSKPDLKETLSSNEPTEPPTAAYTGPERRTNVEQRKRVSEMTPEEKDQALLTSAKTGLPNDRAYAEAVKKPVQVSMDADSLKWINDNLGHPAGDAMLRGIAEVLQKAGLEAYHVSGDEFVAQGDTHADVASRLDYAHLLLKESTFSYEDAQGETRTFTGAGISHGIADTQAAAEDALKRAKSEREASGERAGRGERPPRLAEVGGRSGAAAAGEELPAAVAERGAPAGVEAAGRAEVGPKAEGVDTRFKTGDETHTARWAVYDINDLVTSHTDALNENPAYPKDLQPRDRTRQASREQIAEMAQKLDPRLMGENPLAQHGAPIIGPDGVVESGNARTIALRHAYGQGGEAAQQYRNWLTTNAATFGLDPADAASLKGVERPVLVRVRTSELTPAQRVQFTRTANARETAAMGATEQARADAERMTPALMNLFDVGESGEISAATNRAFVREFIGSLPTAEQGAMRTAEGGISQEGMRRIRNAVFFHAYGDAEALTRLAESMDDPARNITNGMLRAAGPIVDLRARIAAETVYPVDIVPDLLAAARKLAALRDQNETVTGFLAQVGMFGQDLTTLQRSVLVHLDQNKRSAKRIAATLADYADLAVKAGNPSSGILFEDIAPPEKATLWQAALDRNERMAQSEPGLFAEAGETPTQGKAAEASRTAAGGAARTKASARPRVAKAGTQAETSAAAVAPKPAAKPRAKKTPEAGQKGGEVRFAETPRGWGGITSEGTRVVPQKGSLASPVRWDDLEEVAKGVAILHAPGPRPESTSRFLTGMAPAFNRAYNILAGRAFNLMERVTVERVGLTTIKGADDRDIFGVNFRRPDGTQWIFVNPFLTSSFGSTAYRSNVVNTRDTPDNLARSLAMVTVHEMAHFNVRMEGEPLWAEMDRMLGLIGDGAFDEAMDVIRGAVTKANSDDFTPEYRKARDDYFSEIWSAGRALPPGYDASLAETGPGAGERPGVGSAGRAGGTGPDRGQVRQVAPQEQQQARQKPPTAIANYDGPSDPNLKKFTQENRAVSTSEPLATRVKRDTTDVLHWLSREFPALPKAGWSAVLHERMRAVRPGSGQRRAADEAVFNLQEQLDGLGKKQLEVFSDLMVARDMLRDIERQKERWIEGGRKGSFEPIIPVEGITEPELRAQRDELEALAASDPGIKAALDRMVDVRLRVTDPHMALMKDVMGREITLEPETYLRHKVIAYQAAAREMRGRGSKFARLLNPSYLRARKGTRLAYDTDFATAEMDWMPDMLLDNKLLELYQYVRDTFDVTPELARRALAINDEQFETYLDHLAATAGKTGAAHQQPLRARETSAAAIRLGRYAAEGKLPDTQNGRWKPLLDELAGNHQLNEQRLAAGLTGHVPLHVDALDQLGDYAAWLRDQGVSPGTPRTKQTAATRAAVRKAAGKEFVDVPDLMPEGHRPWTAVPGSVLHRVETMPAQLIEAMQAGDADQIGAALVAMHTGKGIRRPLILRNEVADALDQLLAPRPQSKDAVITRGWNLLQGKIKGAKLTFPPSAVDYFVHNLASDVDRNLRAGGIRTVAGTALQVMRGTARDVAATMLLGRQPPPWLREYFRLGGRANLQTQAEGLGGGIDIGGRYSLRARPLLERLWNVGGNWRNAPHETRETIGRAALYRYLLADIEKHGKVRTYGASIPDVIDALLKEEGPEAAAFRMAQEWVIDYDETTAAGQFIAKNVYPFWRYQEGSFRYEGRLLMNAARNVRAAFRMGRKLGVEGPFTLTYQVGRWYLLVKALAGAAWVWNHYFREDEEDKLDERTRNRPHLTFTNPVTGHTETFNRFSSGSEVAGWLDLDNIGGYAEAINRGTMTLEEVPKEMWQTAANRFLTGTAPQYQLIPKLGGIQTYPDVFQPRKGRDPWEAFFAEVNLDTAYRAIARIPQKPNTLTKMFFGTRLQDFNENAYFEMRGYARDWLARRGKPGDFFGGESTAKTSAAYWYHQAIRMGDAAGARFYLGLYGKEHGDDAGLQRAKLNMEPLGRMQPVDREEFLAKLSPADQMRMRMSYNHWLSLVAPEADLKGMENMDLADYIAEARDITKEEIKAQTPVEDRALIDPELADIQEKAEDRKLDNRLLRKAGY